MFLCFWLLCNVLQCVFVWFMMFNNVFLAAWNSAPGAGVCRVHRHRTGLPCILHHAPCTLHPAPCTLYPAPCTLHPAPCTLHPAPCTLNPTAGRNDRGPNSVLCRGRDLSPGHSSRQTPRQGTPGFGPDCLIGAPGFDLDCLICP